MELSLDRTIVQNIVKTLEDGRAGYTEAASLMREDGNDELAARFESLADQRERFTSEIVQFASAKDVDIEVEGSLAGDLHRVWMELKSAVTDADEEAILEAIRNAEDHATMEYRDVLESDMDDDLEALLQRQHDAIHDAYHEIKEKATS